MAALPCSLVPCSTAAAQVSSRSISPGARVSSTSTLPPSDVPISAKVPGPSQVPLTPSWACQCHFCPGLFLASLCPLLHLLHSALPSSFPVCVFPFSVFPPLRLSHPRPAERVVPSCGCRKSVCRNATAAYNNKEEQHHRRPGRPPQSPSLSCPPTAVVRSCACASRSPSTQDSPHVLGTEQRPQSTNRTSPTDSTHHEIVEIGSLLLVQVVVPVSAARPPRFASRVFAPVRTPKILSSETARYLPAHSRRPPGCFFFCAIAEILSADGLAFPTPSPRTNRKKRH